MVLGPRARWPRDFSFVSTNPSSMTRIDRVQNVHGDGSLVIFIIIINTFSLTHLPLLAV